MADINLQINRGRLLSELETIGRYIINNDVNFQKYNINGFLNFNSIAANLYGVAIDPNIILEYKPDIFKKYKKIQDKEVDTFFDFLYANRDLLIETFKNANDFFSDDLNFIQFQYYDCFRKYNEEEFKNIILDFYHQYGDKYYSAVKKYFDEERIQTNYDTKDLLAMFTYSKLVSSGYIFSNKAKIDTRFAATLVHELGHAINAETFVFPQQKNIGIISDPYSEIPSTCFEGIFAQQLVDKKIDYSGGLILLNQLYAQIYTCASAISTLLPLEEYVYDDECNLYFSLFDENDNHIGIDSFQIRDSIVYGLGHLTALYFNKIDKKDRKEFLKIYNDIVTGRKEYSFEDLINRLGITTSEFSQLKYVKEDIKENEMKLRKRFNYHS